MSKPARDDPVLRKDNNDDKADVAASQSQDLKGDLLKANNQGQKDARRITGEYEYVDQEGRMGV